MNQNSQSYEYGASSQPLIYDTIGQFFERICQQHADREAVVATHQSVRKTYAELKRDVDAVAAGFISLGLKVGDRVGIWSPNYYEWVLTQLATARAGLILVTINPAYRVHELEFVLNRVQCKALVLAESFKTSDYIAMMQSLAPELSTKSPGDLASAQLPHLNWVIKLGSKPVAGMLQFDQLYTRANNEHVMQLEQLSQELQPDDAINIQFTSGTTGSPKGATLSHYNILNNGHQTAARMQFTESDRLCIPVPLYHCFGMVMGVLGCLAHGACMVLPSDAFDPSATLKTIANEKCTACYGVPTMFIAMLELTDFAQYDLSRLRTGIMAGAPCPAEIMKRVNNEMNMHQVTIAYGMTETSPVSFQSHVNDSLEQRVSTVGVVHPHVEVKIVDEQGRMVARGKKGELCTRGYSVMLGYWDDKVQTAEVIDNAGWMHTGDLAIIDDNGYAQIVGRVKDMVIRGGENIYPREIEEFLFTHADIKDVAVFGVPDEKYGEQLCAWVQLNAGATLSISDIQAFCRQNIAHYKVPHFVKLVDTFPMTVTGKIQKFKMREMMIAKLDDPID